MCVVQSLSLAYRIPYTMFNHVYSFHLEGDTGTTYQNHILDSKQQRHEAGQSKQVCQGPSPVVTLGWFKLLAGVASNSLKQCRSSHNEVAPPCIRPPRPKGILTVRQSNPPEQPVAFVAASVLSALRHPKAVPPKKRTQNAP